MNTISFPIEIDENTTTWLVKEVYREVIISKYRDPLTLPKSKSVCIRKVRGVCVEWAVKWKYYYREGYLVIDLAEEEDINRHVAECLRTSAVAALLAALIAAYIGGEPTSAAETAFLSALAECLRQKIQNEIIDIRIEWEGDWGDWE